MDDRIDAGGVSGLRCGLLGRTDAGGLAGESDREDFCRGSPRTLGSFSRG